MQHAYLFDNGLLWLRLNEYYIYNIFLFTYLLYVNIHLLIIYFYKCCIITVPIKMSLIVLLLLIISAQLSLKDILLGCKNIFRNITYLISVD